jgi:hypothetical protein
MRTFPILAAATAILLLSVPPFTGTATAQTARFAEPVLVTSAGQSVEVALAGRLFKQERVAATIVPLAGAADLAGKKTLVIVPGFSPKGLGSAGLDKDREMARVKALVAAARQWQVPIVVMHLGGKARRGAQTDAFSAVAAAAAQYLLVVRSGNDDQFFTRLAKERKLSLDVVERTADAGTAIRRLFK